ncbi:PfkB family carbohydrate kinase [Patulibacter defluvii]|uniref:PfkB family carbohydrate kinase n=1 Tax=Patulibacter defluvii TaxID=3095358 RepID=UPI002A75E32B|nr:PfkB family carbohydrate kinase [Patulibacter sp. DM4]
MSDDAPVLVLGEVLVDAICEHPVASFDEVDGFVPHVGGAKANVAVVLAREGGRAALAGVVGDDPWGRWLRRRLAAEGVDLTWLLARPEVVTPIAFVAVDADAEPTYAFHGDGLTPGFGALAPLVEAAVDGSRALYLGTSMQVAPDHRAVVRAARDRALRRGRPVVVDPNLRFDLWPSPDQALAVAREAVPGAFLVKANRAELRAISGRDDPHEGARALLDQGAANVVVTLGAEGALLVAGDGTVTTAAGVTARAVNAIGAGDTVAGLLLARLARDGWTSATLAAALPDAVAAAARSTERWGAVS